jgi:hypothetical protein
MKMLNDLQPIFVVGGIGVLAYGIETVLIKIGQEDKIVFLKIAAWSCGAFVAWDVWWKLVHYVERVFGV